ncbi:MAG: aspartate-semialdehyde dehydrogenase [Planctomycetes bacterium]|nr:aspartate-semialdehyde dehydrogenase [Planctomycetota bacterium]
MSKYSVAIAGATGAVGQEMLRMLVEREFPMKSIRALASKNSVGKKVSSGGIEAKVEELTKDSFKGVDVAFFSAGADRSIEFGPAAAESGAIVIDNSSAFRMEPDVPLVVPEVNAEAALDHRGIIANPNCSTIILVVPLAPFVRKVGVKRLVITTYQAVSGQGQQGIEELEKQIDPVREGKDVTPKKFTKTIAFNVIPQCDKFLPNLYTKEEMKLVNETRKILGNNSIRISATCVRVPVFRAHSESVNMELERKVTRDEALALLRGAAGVVVEDDPERSIYPTPLEVAGKFPVFVGRVREDISQENGIDFWCVGDQLLKGAALNAVQIAEYLHSKNAIKK